MAPRRKVRRTRRTQSSDYYVFRGLLSPSSTATFTRTFVPKDWVSRGFSLTSASIECSAYDSATANKLTVQPGFLQWRLIDPNVLHSPSGPDTEEMELCVSNPLMFGTQPRRKRLPVAKNWYPPNYNGNYFALDCLCPQDGWEGGIVYLLTIKVILGREPRSEKCREFITTSDGFVTF